MCRRRGYFRGGKLPRDICMTVPKTNPCRATQFLSMETTPVSTELDALSPTPKPYLNHTQSNSTINPSPLRANMIDSALQFLRSPSVRSSPLDSQTNFLRSKGLSQEEIEYALHTASTGDSPSSTYNNCNDDYYALSRTEYIPKWLFWTALVMSGVGAASLWYQRADIGERATKFFGDLKRDTLEVLGLKEPEPTEQELKLKEELEDLKDEMGEMRRQLSFLMTNMHNSPRSSSLLTPDSSDDCEPKYDHY